MLLAAPPVYFVLFIVVMSVRGGSLLPLAFACELARLVALGGCPSEGTSGRVVLCSSDDCFCLGPYCCCRLAILTAASFGYSKICLPFFNCP